MLAECRGAAEAASIDYPQLVYPYLEKEISLATPIPLQRLCQLALVSRAGFYRWRKRPASGGCRHGVARCNPADRSGVQLLWPLAGQAGAVAPGLEGEPQTYPADHAGRQPAVPAEATVCRDDHRLQPRSADLSESGQASEPHGPHSALGG